jgi:hypothetical protein
MAGDGAGPTRSDLAVAGLYLFVLLVWAIITARAWMYRRSARPRSQLFRFAPLATGLITLQEPFFSLKEKGTGLGLAIARRTVEAHGGRIDAVSAPGAA